ncbi:hypothetical protein [Lacunimicrobium album]
MHRHLIGSLTAGVVLMTFVTHTSAGVWPFGKKEKAESSHSKIQQVNYAAEEPGQFEGSSAKPIQATPLTYRPAGSNEMTVNPTGHNHHHHAYPHPPIPYTPGYIGNGGNQYPNLDAPLYPSPTPNVPPYVGGTYITNQAFAPHEMLYSHDYHSMYGPYYWKVNGKYVLTPFGVRSHECWDLQGTEVKVKYRSQQPLFSKFSIPH